MSGFSIENHGETRQCLYVRPFTAECEVNALQMLGHGLVYPRQGMYVRVYNAWPNPINLAPGLPVALVDTVNPDVAPIPDEPKLDDPNPEPDASMNGPPSPQAFPHDSIPAPPPPDPPPSSPSKVASLGPGNDSI